ncbi:type II toxin-antitoxin system RelB/DinJ family antitoxin [Weissella confusa]|uniref:type II toxin-antitoxin system RelB/DinJ family antitoxin n=1 Tax=Weissella confusa TaxID=1583 RepID=UPI0035A2A5CC
MAHALDKTAFTLRINSDTKTKADELAERMGISLTSAINLCVEQFVHDGGFPFQPTTKENHPLSEKDIDPKFMAELIQLVEDAKKKPGLSTSEIETMFEERRKEW